MKYPTETILTVKKHGATETFKATVIATDIHGTKYQVAKHGWMNRPMLTVIEWVFENEVLLAVACKRGHKSA